MDKTRMCCTCKHKSKAMCQYPCIECFGWNKHVPNPLPMTNADRIRNMTDEELAEFIDRLNRTCIVDALGGKNECDKECRVCKAKVMPIINWLQAEVKEGVIDECS